MVVEGVRGDIPFRERRLLLSLHKALRRPWLEFRYGSNQPCSTDTNQNQNRWGNGWSEDPSLWTCKSLAKSRLQREGIELLPEETAERGTLRGPGEELFEVDIRRDGDNQPRESFSWN